MRQEGVRIETLVTPVAAKMQDGKLEAITFRRNVLGQERDGGKPDDPADPRAASSTCPAKR